MGAGCYANPPRDMIRKSWEKPWVVIFCDAAARKYWTKFMAEVLLSRSSRELAVRWNASARMPALPWKSGA